MGYSYYDQVAKYAKRDELQQQYNLNIAKTTGKNSFKASVTYKNNAYEDKYSKDQSVGININNITKLTRWMDMEIGAYMLFGDEDRQTYNPLSSFSTGYDIMPYDRLVNDDGTYYTRPASQLYTSNKQNILDTYGLYSELFAASYALRTGQSHSFCAAHKDIRSANTKFIRITQI